MKTSTAIAHPKTLVTLRTVCATFGGYAASAAFSLLVSHLSGLEGRQGESLIRLVFFVAYCTVILWSFAINTHRKAFAQMAVLNALVWCSYWILVGGEA